MRRHENDLIDPEVEACLDAIDATLAGEPVDPQFAEVAELALLVAAERPRPSEAFGRELDSLVARRFGRGEAMIPSRPRAARRGARWWTRAGAFATACLAAVIAVVALASGPTTHAPVRASGGEAATASTAKPAPATAASAASSAAGGPSSRASAAAASGALRTSPDANLAAPLAAAVAQSGASLQLPGNGRKVIQSAEVDLATTRDHIDDVSQEVFDAVAVAGGIVEDSSVTQSGGVDGSATFALRIPSSALSQTMSRLSSLRGAHVLARTDASRDVNGQYVSATRALADARALRAALLRQLAAAVTASQIDSLKAQIRNAESTIAADEAALQSLNSQISYSRVAVTISGQQAAAAAKHGSGGLTLRHAAHIAGRVLVVSAAIALVALAVLAPLALLAALVASLSTAARRRRRERALDLA